MSAGLSINDTAAWGTNGAVKALVGAMHREAAERLGSNAPLTVFLRSEHDAFFIGKVVFLDDWAKDAEGRSELLEVMDSGVEQLLKQGIRGDYGRDWLSQILASLRTALSESDAV